MLENVRLKRKYNKKWTALYLPALSEGQSDPSKFDLDSKKAAEQYVFSRMCKSCKEERHRALTKTSDPNNEMHQFDSLWPGCSCEWEVMPTADYARCENFGDIMEATGAKVIYRKT